MVKTLSMLSSDILEILKLVCLILSSLIFGFSVAGQNPRKTAKGLIGVAFLILAIYLYDNTIFTNPFYLIGLLAILIPITKKRFKISYPLSITALLFTLVLFLNGLVFCQILSTSLAAIELSRHEAYANLIVTSIYGLLAYTIYRKRFTFFPEDIKDYLGSKGVPRKEFQHYILLTTLVSILMFIWTLYIVNNFTFYPLGDQLMIFSFSALIFVVFSYFIKISFIYAANKIEILVDKEYQEELLNFMHLIRSQRHDFNFHIQAISGMLNNGKYDECENYVKTMVEEISATNEVLPLYHPAVSALLNTFWEIATQKGIRFDIQIYYNLEKLPCTVYEVNKIIGNLIQNALDEVEEDKTNEPWIKVIILKRGGNGVIRVSNKNGKETSDYRNIFKAGYSTKKSHEGIGLTTVQKIVSKYNGAIHVELREDIIDFIAQIPIHY